MIRLFRTVFVLVMFISVASGAAAQTPSTSSDPSAADTVHVAPPTGDHETDRGSILAAIGTVQPGGVVQFAPGTYLIGEFLQVSTPRVRLQGHPEGTTLRGCDPAVFRDVEAAVAACNGLALTGERQTVRGLTFEHMWQALWVGCCLELAGGENEPGTRHVGGHLVEGNTFRASVNGFRVIGDSPEPVLVRDNDFVNVWHAGAVNGRTAHILGNRISVPDAAQVPPNGFPGLALIITPYDTRLDRAFTCAGNIVAGNRVEGHPEGIAILAFRAGAICRDNVIRENTIRVDRVGFTGAPWGVTGIGDPADSTLVGVPIALSDLSAQTTEIFGLPAEPGDEVLIQDNLIEGNRIVGAEGLGIEILGASGNRIVDNIITGVAVRDPFPGNTMYVPPPWGEANGSGIWISPGSDGNEIVGNTFADIAGAAVVLEGDSNRVELREQDGGARDLGTGNAVVIRAGAEHEMHIRSPDLHRIMDAAMRATIPALEDAPPISAPTAAHAIEALDHAGMTYGLALSSGYFWGSPSLRSPRMVPILDSLGLDIGDSRGRVRAENLYLAEQVARFPDRLVGACSVNPLADYALEELELCAADPRITAFALYLAPAAVDFGDDSHVVRLRTFFEALSTTDLAVIVHMRNRGEGYGAEDAGVFIREVLAAVPGVPVQIAHMAGWGPYDEATDSAMQAFADAFEDGTLDRDRFTFGLGVVVEDSEAMEGGSARARRAAEQNARLAERMREIGIDRVVLSTDWPFFPPIGDPRTRISENRALLRKVLPLDPEELDRFFSKVGAVFQRVADSGERRRQGLARAADAQYRFRPPVSAADTVHVAPPSGNPDTDRASILAALGDVEPGGTVRFAVGTYLVGERVRVPVPGVTILGHPAGTTLRGCEPSELERRARMECMGLELTGGRQTVRGLTFEHAGFDLILGCCIDPGEAPPSADPGGYLVEDNTFQASGTGVRVIAGPSETTVIRGNQFRDLFHAVGVNAGTVHLVDNDVSAPRPERVPGSGHTGGAIIVSHRGQDACDGHVIAGNRIDGHPSAIVLVVFDPGTRCRGTVIRDNTIVVRRAHFTEAWPGIRVGSEADSTVVGVPIAVVNLVASGNQPSPPAAGGRGGEGVIGGHLIEGNRVMGAEGIGIEIRGSSGNRILDNVVTGIELRDPFPGNVANSADPEAWRDANGSGIWVSPGSEDNEIVGNTFEDVAGAEVFLAGDRNRVELQSPSDSVRDLGTGNEVSVADGAEGSDVAPEERVAGEADTVHVAPPTGEMETDRASIRAAAPNPIDKKSR